MTSVAPGFAPPVFSSGQHDSEYDEVDYEEEDLGVGTSSGAGYRGLGGSRPLTITSLLGDKVQFGSPQLKLDAEEITYIPINVKAPPPSAATPSLGPPPSPTSSTTKPSVLKATPLKSPAASSPSLLFPTISPAVSWPKQLQIGAGLNNVGNTCFLNSALQVLLHTAPLVRFVLEQRHKSAECGYKAKKGFCMTCAMTPLVLQSFEKSSLYTPKLVTANLRKIAQHLRLGRQEDAHEFLRFCIDNMQLSALFGKPAKLDQRIKDSTFVHQIFGGRLRSRVVCSQCQHPSDTFDSMLDLSLDIQRVDSVKEALADYVKIDHLKGANKYKCEKCKKFVNAEKSFTIHEAPMVLTIHLKRFTPSGRKIGDSIKYPEVLHLGPYMSDRTTNPTYRLYGIINHSGGGPHSGHYTAHVKSAAGGWYHMNDSIVSPTPDGKPPLHARTAYVLFYARQVGDALTSAIHAGTKATNGNGVGMTNGNRKRPRESDGFKKGGAGWTNDGAGSAKKAHMDSPRPPVVQASNGSPAAPYRNSYDSSRLDTPPESAYSREGSQSSRGSLYQSRGGGRGGRGGQQGKRIKTKMVGQMRGRQNLPGVISG